MPSAVHVQDLTGDVIVLDQKNDRTHHVPRGTRTFQQRSLDGEVFLVLGIVVRETYRTWRHRVHLDFGREGLRQTAGYTHQQRLRDAVGQVLRPDGLPRRVDNIHYLAPSLPDHGLAGEPRQEKRRLRVGVDLFVPQRRSRLVKRCRAENRRAVDQNIESAKACPNIVHQCIAFAIVNQIRFEESGIGAKLPDLFQRSVGVLLGRSVVNGDFRSLPGQLHGDCPPDPAGRPGHKRD